MTAPLPHVGDDLIRSRRQGDRIFYALIAFGLAGGLALVGFICWAIAKFTVHVTGAGWCG